MIAFANLNPRKVGVACGDAVAVIDLDHLAVTAFASGVSDDTGPGAVNRRASGSAEVDTAMKRKPA